jgi:hypothetical protein
MFRLQGLALDLSKDKEDQELVTKFVTSLDRRLAEQTSSQAMAATKKPTGAYTREEAYEAALRVQAVNTRLRIARELAPRWEIWGSPGGGGSQPRRRWSAPRAPTQRTWPLMQVTHNWRRQVWRRPEAQGRATTAGRWGTTKMGALIRGATTRG